MIKDAEIAMVNAATFALNYQDKNYNADAAEIIKQFTKEPNYFNMKSGLQIYSVAAINEIIKMKQDKTNKTKTNKQLLQAFMKLVPEISRRIKEEEDY